MCASRNNDLLACHVFGSFVLEPAAYGVQLSKSFSSLTVEEPLLTELSPISLRDVQLEFPQPAETVVALRDINLDVGEGEFVALTGISGSGKTSLINVLSGLTSVTGGEASVMGQQIEAASARDRAALRLSTIGVVFQDHNLIPEFTVQENVELPLRARGFSGKDARDEALRWLGRVGLSGMEKRRPAQLSGGQKQRVGVARALAGGRTILLADEPTGSLDAENSRAMFELLSGLASDGATVVTATHDPAIRAWATRAITMSDGVIVSDELIGQS